MTAAQTQTLEWIEIEAVTGDTSGEALWNRAVEELGFHGGGSFSDTVVNDVGAIRITFYPGGFDGDLNRLLGWVKAQAVEYEVTFGRLKERD